jgi:ankyrin repeat protein
MPTLKNFFLFHSGDGFTARFLLENGASVSIVTPERGDTALHMIASSSPDMSPDESMSVMNSVAKMLLDKGLDPNMQNNQGL